MIRQIKQALYFPAAWYFRFWASFVLRRWQPRIILITGSSGKTTLLHLLEAQLGEQAHYSHKANSSFGIPFDILGFATRTNARTEWIKLILGAPIKAFGNPHNELIYIVEADTDRPGEAKFISQLIRPEVTVWLSSDRSHSAGFDNSTGHGQRVEQIIAHEFGDYLRSAHKRAIINAGSDLIMGEAKEASITIEALSQKTVTKYELTKKAAIFVIGGQTYTIPALEPEETGMSLMAVIKVCQYLNIPVDEKFSKFLLPAGRSSVFAGLKGTTLIDSTYNAIPDAVRAMLNLFKAYPGEPKWLVLGDMVEQGKSEASEHTKLAAEIANLSLARIILVGPRLAKYTAPALLDLVGPKASVTVFSEPKPALDFLKENIQGGEIIMFKGARFLEGVVEHLLANPSDVSKLCRRELVWEKRRQQWGL